MRDPIHRLEVGDSLTSTDGNSRTVVQGGDEWAVYLLEGMPGVAQWCDGCWKNPAGYVLTRVCSRWRATVDSDGHAYIYDGSRDSTDYVFQGWPDGTDVGFSEFIPKMVDWLNKEFPDED